MNSLEHINFSFLNPKLFAKTQKIFKKHKSLMDFKHKSFEFINQSYFMKEDSIIHRKKKFNTAKKVSIFLNGLDEKDKSKQAHELIDIIKPVRESSGKSAKNAATTDDLPQPILVKNVLTLERENTNPYFWYYNKNECERESCMLRHQHLPELDATKKAKYRSSTEESGIKSILKEPSGSKKLVDLSNCACSEFRACHSGEKDKKMFASTSTLRPKKLSEKSENYYKSDQELMNSKNFVQLPKPPTPLQTVFKEEPLRGLLIAKLDEPKSKKSLPYQMSYAELKKLNIDERYLNEAQRMLFKPESNSFELIRY